MSPSKKIASVPHLVCLCVSLFGTLAAAGLLRSNVFPGSDIAPSFVRSCDAVGRVVYVSDNQLIFLDPFTMGTRVISLGKVVAVFSAFR